MTQADRETASHIDRRCNKQMRETEEKIARTEAKEKRGPRTFKQMLDDGTVRRFPQTASLSHPWR